MLRGFETYGEINLLQCLVAEGNYHKIKKMYEGCILNKNQVERTNVFTEAGIVYMSSKINIILMQKMRTALFNAGNAVAVGAFPSLVKLIVFF